MRGPKQGGRCNRLGVALAAIVCLSVFIHEPARAQQAISSGLGASPEEEDAYKAFRENQLIGARNKAEKALEKNPDGILGNYVLGLVMREAEGDLAKAMVYMGRARELYEKRYGTPPPPTAPWAFHRELLYSVQALAGEMDEYEYQLEILRYHNALYDPDFVAEEAWALLKLQKVKEARERAQQAAITSDPWQKGLGKNALCAIETEAQERERAHAACMDALQFARDQDKAPKDSKAPAATTHIAVHAYNAALAARGVLKFQEEEALLREAAARREFTIANPYRLLVRLYVDQGKGAEAASALRDMQAWRQRNPSALRDQDRAETEGTAAILLLAAGGADPGLRLIRRAIDMPDRHGLVSDKPEQRLGANAVLAGALLRLRAERTREEASVYGTLPRWKRDLEAFWQEATSWAEDERARSVLADSSILEATFRTYLPGGLDPLPSWLLGDVIEVVGRGVAGAAVRRARGAEKMMIFAPYYDALEAELAWRRGKDDEALALGEGALRALPSGETLLRARLSAILGDTARKRGDGARAMKYFTSVLEKDPGVLRRLGLRLPARVSSSGGDPVTSRAETLLGRSPRFVAADADAFHLTLSRTGDRFRICLKSPAAVDFLCTEQERLRTLGPKKNGVEAESDFAARTVDDFHRQAFLGKFGLSDEDLKLLDGAQSLAQRAQRDAVKKAVE